MTTYDEIHQRILRALNDASGKTYDDSLVYDGIVAAHDAILPWVPKQAMSILTTGSDGISIILPSDLYEVMALFYPTAGVFIPRANLVAFTRRSQDYANDWIEYPSGQLTLSVEIDQSEELKLYYLAYWPAPANESDTSYVIQVPREAHQGMIYYACSHCLVPRAVNSASIRQFNQRVDSGNPEDNPLKAESEWMLNRFFQEMKLMPPYVKVGT
jgi:hypothetical protein